MKLNVSPLPRLLSLRQKLAWELSDDRIERVHHICEAHPGYLRAKLVGVQPVNLKFLGKPSHQLIESDAGSIWKSVIPGAGPR